MSRNDVWRAEYLTVECPRCAAQAGEACKGARGGDVIPHAERRDIARDPEALRRYRRTTSAEAQKDRRARRKLTDVEARALFAQDRLMDGRLHPGAVRRDRTGEPRPQVKPVEEVTAKPVKAAKPAKVAAPSGTLREKVLRRAAGRCELRIVDVCTAKAFNVHHLRPRGHGGTNEQTNLRASCAACHDYIHRNEQWAISAGLLEGVSSYGPAIPSRERRTA